MRASSSGEWAFPLWRSAPPGIDPDSRQPSKAIAAGAGRGLMSRSAPPKGVGKDQQPGGIMKRVNLTIATTDYDHFRDFRLGLVQAEGVDHTWLTLGHHEIFARFTLNREWDV